MNPGHEFGPYRIVGPIGAGGMGEVFQATDTRLGRDVALKFLPEAMAADTERMARFEREARVLASLNHPNIAALFGVENVDGRRAIAMELVPGEDLTRRIDSGPLPLEEALGIALQMARALETAHLKGIIHRDLKPANVRLTPDGQVKVLDFGLAKPTASDASSASQVDARLSQSPTIGAATQAGLILGTAAYMSPEQARGRSVDARTDIFSFGCVLFEMLSGTRIFDGEDISEILASVIKGDIAWARLPADLPAPVLALLKRCLATRADERYQAIGDVRYDLARFVADPSTLAPAPAVSAAPVVPARARLVPLALAALGLVAAAVFAGLYFTRPQPHRQTVRFELEPPAGARSFLWPRLSPDGSKLAYLGADSTAGRRIYIRPIDGETATALTGTESAGRPFWSPDGTMLAFMVGEKLKKVAATGGPIVLIADASGRFDGSWGADGMILLDGGPGDSLLVVSSTGGAVKPATSLDRTRSENSHAWPSFLPDGKRFLFTADTATSQLDLIKLGRLGSFETTVVDSCDSRVEYVAPGYLLYARSATLFARRFDLASGKCSGEPFPIVENLGNLANSGDFSGSLTGSIAYRARSAGSQERIVLVDRAGKTIEVLTPPANYASVAPSPDGTRIAFGMRDDTSGNLDLWVKDLRRGTTSRLTFDPADDDWPVWSPDGTEIAWSSPRDGPFRVFIKLASGVGAERKVAGQPVGPAAPSSWNGPLGLLSIVYTGATGSWDLQALSARDSLPPVPIAESPQFSEIQGRFSPDGRWVAVQSGESGRPQIYVQSYPVPSSRWQVSTTGGVDPEWRADGRELFYRSLNDTLMVIPITPGETFEWGTPQPLFATGAVMAQLAVRQWTPSADGQRFYIVREQSVGRPAPISVVVDWAGEVERLKKR